MGLEYKKIHACPNDCVLYEDEFVSFKVCPTCELSWFKRNLMEVMMRKKIVVVLANNILGFIVIHAINLP